MSPAPTALPGRHLEDGRQLNVSECRRWIEQHHEGRLGYLSGRGPRSVVVSYAVVGDEIRVRVPDYNDIAHYAPGAQVTLAVDGAVPHSSAIEEVSVTGTAGHREGCDQAPVDAAQSTESWPAAIKTSVVTLNLTQVEGVRRRLDAHQDHW